MLRILLVAALASAALASAGCATVGEAEPAPVRDRAEEPVSWEPWSPDAFTRAGREGKLVLLYVEAVWCHWCHVMDHETYGDAAVARLVRDRYVAVRADADARPDLAERYRRWAWPATVVFAPDGRELVKRRGFVPPARFAALLARVAENPTAPSAESEPLPEVSDGLTDRVREALERRHDRAWDDGSPGLRLKKKRLDLDSVRHALRLAADGDGAEEDRVRAWLDASLALIDPVWGGVYQYSHGGDWEHPHFEKIMSSQATALGAYSAAARQLDAPRWRHAAEAVARWLRDFATAPDGGFYTSQDADVVRGEHAEGYFAEDDAGRRALGIPAVDTNRYARENGWLIAGLVDLYRAGDDRALAQAEGAARWVLANRQRADGGFDHGAEDHGASFLGDGVAMGLGCFALWEATGEHPWLDCAERALAWVDATFRGPDDVGYVTASAPPAPGLAPVRTIDENLAVGRLAVRVLAVTEDPRWRAAAERALRWLAIPQVATSRLTDPGILDLADDLARGPVHITIVGRRTAPATTALHRAALRVVSPFTVTELADPDDPRPDHTLTYPVLDRPALYACDARSCSPPVFAEGGVAAAVARLGRR